MSNKEQYRTWSSMQDKMPIFMQPWWLDAVCAGKEWDVLLSKDEHGTILAAMPYLFRQKAGFKWIIMPQLTQIGGIWIPPGSICQGADTQAQSTAICHDLAQQLRALRPDYYCQQYPISSSAVAAMQAMGYRVKERITYRLTDLSDMNAVIAGFSRDKRRQLRKAADLVMDTEMTVDQLYDFHAFCLHEQGKQISYSRDLLHAMHLGAVSHQQGQILRIRNEQGDTQAAAMVVWDQQTLYYLIQCHTRKDRATHAGERVALEAIRLAARKGLIFDFEGSMIPGIAEYFRQFGATPATYYSVEKYNNPLFAIVLATNWIRNIHKR